MIERGQIYIANLDPVFGSEQGGTRPVLIIQNDMGNKYSPTVIVAAITSSGKKGGLPTHIMLSEQGCLGRHSTVLLEQLRTIDKERLKSYVGAISSEELGRINDALRISVGCSCETLCEQAYCRENGE